MSTPTNNPQKRKRRVPSAELRLHYPEEFQTETKQGNPVTVLYKRISVRGGYDIEAAILSGPPKAKE